MYTGYFGLSESPFSIAPNPHFLFMSDRHKEALAHLSYGLGETGGFVLLTGEVGTGKTTVSRCLLESLPEHTQAAFILNPTLSAQELLATICDELKIRYRKTGATLKTLTDKIQQKLLKNHEDNIHTILLIDEAQHLRPEVLEQLRLLTNLETHTKKLLQVILIGQPELQQLLDRQDLRQLAQRITARYHLLPLTLDEVNNYISHRLQIAGCNQTLFTAKAVKQVHKLSNGVPRLINLLCDRALLGAYAQQKTMVDHKLISSAHDEVTGKHSRTVTTQSKNWFALGAGAAAAILVLAGLGYGLGYLYGQGSNVAQSANSQAAETRKTEIALPDASQQPADSTSQVQVSAPVSPAIAQEVLPAQVIAGNRSLPSAFNQLFEHWQLEFSEALDKPCEVANDFGLYCHWHKGSLGYLKSLAHPAVMKFFDERGEAFYGVLQEYRGGDVTVEFNGKNIQPSQAWFDKYWQGGAVILWQAPEGFEQAIDETSEQHLIQWLENQLSYRQQRAARVVVGFDSQLVSALNNFQREQGLPVTDHANMKTVLLLSRS